MENNLPKGWIECKLGDVCSKPQYGWTSKAGKSGKIKYLRTTDISDGSLNWDEVPFCIEEPADKEKYQVRKNDILVSRAGSVGLSFRIKEDVSFDAVFASYLIRFKSYDDATARLLEYFLQSKLYWDQISDFTAGIAIPNVNASKLEELSIPLPPLPEQQRIVEKLDALMARISNSKTRLEKIPTLLKNFRQSVLAAAVSGELTKEWREEKEIDSKKLLEEIQAKRITKYKAACLKAKTNKERKPIKPSNLDDKLAIEEEVDFLTPKIPETWVKVPLGITSANSPNSIVDGPFGSSINVKTDYIESGVPVIRINNVRPLKFVNENLRFISQEKFSELERHNVSSGDILLAKVGATIGDCCIYPEGLPIAMLSTTGSCRITVDDSCFDKQYICFVLNSLKNVMQQIASEVAQPFLNMSTVKNLPIPFCPIEEQKEIVRKVEELFHFANSIEARYQKAKAWFDKLPQSLLAKAFRGELVPQNANDEPASELLKRIQNEKHTITKTPKPAALKTKAKKYRIDEDEGLSMVAEG